MCGDLLGYLRKSRGIHDKYHLGQGSVPKLEIYDLVLFAKQIAAGMVFLGSRGVSRHNTKTPALFKFLVFNLKCYVKICTSF